jgi:hypothetical protein
MPEISPEFTVEDIHKIRAWHAEIYKGMTPEDVCEYTRSEIAQFEQELKEPSDPVIHAEVDRLLQSVKSRLEYQLNLHSLLN